MSPLLTTSIPANFSMVAMSGDQISMNSTSCPRAELQEWQSTVTPVYLLLIAVLGMVLNVFVLMVFCLHKKACTKAEISLSNLAAADLILMICLPMWAVYKATDNNWPFNNSLCQLVTLAISMNALCSIYFLVLISIDRYVALVHPLSLEAIRRPKYAKLGCLLVWCLGFLLSVPSLVYREVKYYPHVNKCICYLDYPSTAVQNVCGAVSIAFGFIIPISIISYCTVKIIQALKNRIAHGLNSQIVEQKATTLVLAVLLAFIICWVPHHLVSILSMLSRANVLKGDYIANIIDNCSVIFMNLAFFNSVLNPILYIIVGKSFQKKVRELSKQWSVNRTSQFNTSTFQSVQTDVASS